MKVLICKKIVNKVKVNMKTKINEIFCFSILMVPSICFPISSQLINIAKEQFVEIRGVEFENIRSI